MSRPEVAPHAMSLVLVQVDNGVQMPVYYVSKSLHKAKVHFGSDACTRKLSHYFQFHTIVVLTQLPLKSLL